MFVSTSDVLYIKNALCLCPAKERRQRASLEERTETMETAQSPPNPCTSCALGDRLRVNAPDNPHHGENGSVVAMRIKDASGILHCIVRLDHSPDEYVAFTLSELCCQGFALAHRW